MDKFWDDVSLQQIIDNQTNGNFNKFGKEIIPPKNQCSKCNFIKGSKEKYCEKYGEKL